MLYPALRTIWLHDLPVCFPGRQCVDQSPLEADVINDTSALTPSSAAIAAGSFAVFGAAFVLALLGLGLQWRGRGVRPWLLVLASALLLVGLAASFAVRARLDAISLTYSNAYGQPSASAPASLSASWPSVLVAGQAMVVLGAVTLFLTLNTTAVRRRKAARQEPAA